MSQADGGPVWLIPWTYGVNTVYLVVNSVALSSRSYPFFAATARLNSSLSLGYHFNRKEETDFSSKCAIFMSGDVASDFL
jgi:hypothetical protein